MTPTPTAPLPGSMTVPPLFGWELVLVGLLVVVLAAVVGLVLLAGGRARGERAEWRAWLAARSAQRAAGSARLLEQVGVRSRGEQDDPAGPTW